MRTNHHFSENGPAVQLSAAHSIFPFQLAHFWKQQGLDTALVTRDLRHDSHGPHGTPIVCSANYRTALDRALTFAPVSLVAHYFEKALIMPFRSRYYRRTGRPRNEAREERFVRHLVAASPTARAARSFSPRFVFGHEITHYGLATAMCDGIPRILFPWGGDVFLYAETSPFMSWIVRRALKSVDLVLPSSTTAARHIQERFGVSPEVAQPLSWGIDRADFERADPPTRVRLLSELGVTDDSRLVLNSRQFNPIWGCFETLDAFLETAVREPKTHFVLLAGFEVEPFIAAARTKIESRGLVNRFTVLDGQVPLKRVAELMSIADVFTSLMGIGDMRSASVLQASAAGGVPIVNESPEHNEMVRQGFTGFLVQPGDSEGVVHAISLALDPDRAAEVRSRNQKYIALHEDRSVQLQKMLHLINTVCGRYAGTVRGRPS